MSQLAKLPAAALARNLPALLGRLRAAGYSVGPSERIAVEGLLVRSALAGCWPPEPPALSRMLAPVLCRSAAEQQGFDAHFESWLADLVLSPGRRPARGRRQGRPEPEPGPTAAQPGRRSGVSLWRLIAATLVVVTLALVARWWVLVTQVDPMTPDSPFIVGRLQPGGPGSGAAAGPGRPLWLVTPHSHLWPAALAVSLWLLPLYYAWFYGGWLPAWLRRRSSSALPVLDRLSLGHPIRSLGAAWRGLLRLSERDLRPDAGLQVEATVRATVDKGGYFTPVYGHRPALPEYLALIDRRSPEDHLARFAAELIARLEERGLATRTLFFSGDPRPGVGGAGHGHASLATLAGRAAGERLLIFGDAGSWLDPERGQPWRGLEAVKRWQQRFLLTPLPSAEWGRREQLLADGWLAPFPLSEPGLAALAERCASRAQHPDTPPATSLEAATAAPGVAGRYPLMLGQNAERWLGETPPSAAMTRELLAAITQYLAEEGSRWLRACAVFPTVSWPVTCYLGQRSTDEAGQPLLNEERLLRLARLPWFRHGKMPSWLRLELIDAMDRAERDRVRRILRDLLAEALRAQAPGSEPEIAQQAARRGDGWLKRALLRQPDDSPLREYLFLTFMRGRKPLRLTLAAPRRLRTLIRDADRWSVLASAALALIGTLAVAAWHRLETVPLTAPADFRDLPRVIPIPSASAFPEGVIAVVNLVLSGLVIAFFGRRHGRLAPPATEFAVPGLIERISARRWPVLGPWVVTTWIGAFILCDFAGSLPGARWIVANLAVLVTLGVYFYLERGIRGGYSSRLGVLSAQLDAGAGTEAIPELLAFLRGPAPTDLKRRGIRLLYAKVREPTAELLSELETLQLGSTLEPRTKSLLQRVARHLEERHRQALGRGEAP